MCSLLLTSLYLLTGTYISLANGVVDTTNLNTLGMEMAEGINTYTVFQPGDNDDHYANGAVLTTFNGKMYCMWQSSRKDEDSQDTWVAYSTSDDEGKTWTKPQVLEALPKSLNSIGVYVASGGWNVHSDTLTAFLNVQVTPESRQIQYVAYKYTIDGEHWSKSFPVLTAEGDTLRGSIEQDAHPLSDGRLVSAVHVPKPDLGFTKMLTPIYTDDPTGRSGWRKGFFCYTDIGKSSREIEPSWFLRGDTIVMLMRDQKSSFHKLVSISTDRGETWTKAEETNILDSRSKQSAGNLPDGTAYIISTISTGKNRWPLTILLSRNGNTFTKGYLLRSKDQLPARHWEGKAKTLGYSYPKTIFYNGFLWTAYTENKENVVITKIPANQPF